jgi:hypothetical protein
MLIMIEIDLVVKFVQSTTLLLAIVAQLLMLVALRRGILAWKYTILPGIYFMSTAVFYFYIVFPVGAPWVHNILVSAMLRLYGYIVICVMLTAWVWYKQKR